jgi:hypothetical protein
LSDELVPLQKRAEKFLAEAKKRILASEHALKRLQALPSASDFLSPAGQQHSGALTAGELSTVTVGESDSVS